MKKITRNHSRIGAEVKKTDWTSILLLMLKAN